MVPARRAAGEPGSSSTPPGATRLLSAKLGFKRRSRKHNTAAMFGHFTGARRLPGKAEGNITIVWFDNGWFWFIPLADGTTSVGAVGPADDFKSRQADLHDFFMGTIASCPEIADRLEDAQLVGPVTATGNYSSSATRMWGKDFILVGDAFAFVDPVFSTGVYLAMKSAFPGADAEATCLDRPRQAAQALRRFERETRRGLDSFRCYIYRVRLPAIRDMFMAPHKNPRLEERVLSLLAGDAFGGSKIGARLLAFKCPYYVVSFFQGVSGIASGLTAKPKHSVELGAGD